MTEHFLFPCTLFADSLPHQALTILGSCVAVCLYDEKRKYGGMNHYMLPWWDGKVMPTPKYGNVAIERLLEKMKSMGSNQDHLVAKIFGGAHQLPTLNSGIAIGNRNVATAEELLGTYRIRIVSRSTGGERGRRILFHTHTNQVFMKYLNAVELETA
jgi:chemotaxis protein CheD